jgi:hypothetical protein
MPVFEVLEQHGLEVYLVNAQHIQNVPGRKSDDVVVVLPALQGRYTLVALRGSWRASGWNRWLGTWTECVSISSTAIRAVSHAVTRSRCAPLASFATHSTHPGFLITGAIGPHLGWIIEVRRV